MAQKLGLPQANVATHSLRIGRATALYHSGVHPEEMEVVGMGGVCAANHPSKCRSMQAMVDSSATLLSMRGQHRVTFHLEGLRTDKGIMEDMHRYEPPACTQERVGSWSEEKA